MRYCRLIARLKQTTEVLVSKWYNMENLNLILLCKLYSGLLKCDNVFEVNIQYSEEGDE